MEKGVGVGFGAFHVALLDQHERQHRGGGRWEVGIVFVDRDEGVWGTEWPCKDRRHSYVYTVYCILVLYGTAQTAVSHYSVATTHLRNLQPITSIQLISHHPHSALVPESPALTPAPVDELFTRRAVLNFYPGGEGGDGNLDV
jgi:hypothetical protein